MSIEKGMKAPGFSLFDTEKNKVTLEEQAGKNIVLLFFPMAFTSVCTKELCSVRDTITYYDNSNATVFGISVDSPFTLAKFKEDQQLNFSLLSDFNKEASRAYGAFYEQFAFEMKGVSKRAAFIIDKAGIIQYAEVLENAGEVPNFTAMNTVLDDIAA